MASRIAFLIMPTSPARLYLKILHDHLAGDRRLPVAYVIFGFHFRAALKNQLKIFQVAPDLVFIFEVISALHRVINASRSSPASKINLRIAESVIFSLSG